MQVDKTLREVRCPKCGQTVLETALEIHQERVCPNRKNDRSLEGWTNIILPKATEQKSQQVEAPKKEVGKTASLSVPTGEASFWISPQNKERLSRIASRSDKGDIVNVLIRGPKGCGKTTLAREFASLYHRPFHEVHCGALVDAEQWFGKDRLNGGETWYRKARFIQGIETPFSVNLLDEVNRAHPEVLNAIFGLLDWRRSIWSDDLGYEVKVAKGVVFFATINEGEDYYGISPLDAALRDRFPRAIKLDYPPRKEEVKILQRQGLDKDRADKLALFAQTLRKATTPVPVSTRQLLVATDELRDGASLRESVETAIINGIEDTSVEKMALQALQWLEDNPYVEDQEVIPLKDDQQDG